MWSVYVFAKDHILVDIVVEVSTRRLLEVLERYSMTDRVQTIKVSYRGDLYCIFEEAK